MIIKSKYIILKDRVLENGALEIKEGKIHKIIENTENIKDFIDYKDNIIAPGYVDTHIHGFSGHDFMDKDSDGLRIICKDILKMGVTSFLPTTLTASTEDLNDVVKMIGENKNAYGAKIQGIFLEGPFFSDKYKGAQNPSHFCKPNIEKLKKWQKLSNGLIKKIAIAPELEGVEDFIKEARKLGIYVALGHSDASYFEAKKAVEAGASIFVHTYNAMSPLHHRNPGMVGAALTLKNVFAELICDGHHVHPASADVVLKCRGTESVALITDCMMAGGMPEGKYKLGDFDVTVKDNTARLNSGNLAGSIVKLKDAVKNVINWGIASPFEAIQMASQIPAKSVGIDNICGIIEEGRDADIIVLNKNYDVKYVYLNGKLVSNN
ncbi:N-acetylglucosamine-6-phosphate deacetylase [Peptostreptococcus canis]|uniref:N-acetylglucosamine-6-phosphate deacetylase n=1 Tax=Peptostreptococcus canis TaxID=1159213 RepID=A0ABR6TKY7_9FIRM|nr:N-acetylglucosamine-6-phosphate deacetylase [Peptostreptococcus canis]MBP1997976.1 N-acetylglucosamine-6-phosphate deacetylase [Peptostreptococcus canis]